MRAIGIGAALFLVACGEPEADSFNCPGQRLTACNVFEASCQLAIYRAAACERDGAVLHDPPPVTVVTVADLQQDLSDAWQDDEPSVEELRWNRAVALLGLEEPATMTLEGRVENATNGLLGFYLPGQREIVLIQQEQELDAEQAVLTLAHEYVHSLQDESVDLKGFLNDRGDSFDGLLAGRSAIEGEASLFEYFVAARMAGHSQRDVDWQGLFGESTDKADAYTQDKPSPLALAASVFPYTYGTYGVEAAYREGKLTGVIRLRESDAESSVTFLRTRHGAFELPQLDAGGGAPPASDAGSEVRLDAGGGGLDAGALEPVGNPPEFQPAGSYQLGAWLVHGFLLHATNTAPAPQLALAWEDDRMAVYVGPDDAVGVIWTIRLTTDGAAELLAERLSKQSLTRENLRSGLVVKRAGNTVHLVITDGSAGLTASLAGSDLTLGQLASNEPLDAPFASRSRVAATGRARGGRPPCLRL